MKTYHLSQMGKICIIPLIVAFYFSTPSFGVVPNLLIIGEDLREVHYSTFDKEGKSASPGTENHRHELDTENPALTLSGTVNFLSAGAGFPMDRIPGDVTATLPAITTLSLLHYWNFNNSATLLAPTQTLSGGSLSVSLAGGATLEPGTGNSFSGVNARNGDPAGSHLVVNNPKNVSLTFNISTVGYENIVFKYETRRSALGPEKQKISYSLDGIAFVPVQEVNVVNGVPEIVSLNLSAISGANNNPDFKIRIEFEQKKANKLETNRFDNVTVEGQEMVIVPPLPAVPVLASPANAAVNIETNPVLSWNAANAAIKYRVQVSEFQNFTPVVFDQANITATSVQLQGLQAGKQYFWRVHASNDNGDSDWSSVRNFTTRPLPAVPVLASPADASVGQVTNPVLSWNAATGASGYRVQVSESQTFATTVSDQSNIITTTAQLQNLQEGKQYFWRVNASNASGASDWSLVWNFTTSAPDPDPEPEVLTLFHYWNFNTATELLTPSQSLNGGSISTSLAALSTIEAGTLNEFSGSNARNNDPAGSHLRLNNPIGSSLTFNLSTVGFENVVVKYETRRSGSGAGVQKISYTLDGTSFVPLRDVSVVDGVPELVTLDFSAISAANNNASFKVRIQFEQGLGGTAGNNRFDNFTTEGRSLGAVNLPPVVNAPVSLQQLIAGSTSSTINLSTVFSDPENKTLTYTASSSNTAVATVAVAGNLLQITTLKAGDASIELRANDGSLDSAPTSFRTLVYPAAKQLAAAAYSFVSWDPNEPEGSFPVNALFLQSATDDPVLSTELLFPYAIPASDYAAADAGNIGFPYRNTSRTRINGLGENGISFINTGRGRDLGATLVAVDTRNIPDARISFKAETLVPNFRVYNLAVLYRVGTTGDWLPVFTTAETPMIYESKEQAANSLETLTGFLPSQAIGQAYVQVLFMYYYTGVLREGTSGSRTQIRLDDIEILQDVRSGTTLPAQVQVLLPSNNQQSVILKPDFSWQAVADASTYQLQVATSNQFTTLVADKMIYGQTSHKLETPLAVATDYFWRVRAVNSSGAGPWSVVRTFKTILEAVSYKLAINEVMASNSSTIADEDGSFEDWIEIVNYGTTSINLQGFGLSDSYASPYKWVFPSKVIGPGQFLLVWASSKNRVDPARPLHTSYAISAQGEEVLLTSPDGERIDEMPAVAIPAGLSRGRQPDGTGSFTFFNVPTPAATNSSGGFEELVSKAAFSVAPGVYTGNITLAITHPDPAVTIRYTLDGSEPTATSPVYQQPLQLVDRSGEANAHSMIPTNYIEGSSRSWNPPTGLVRKGTVVRAKAFKANTLNSEVTTGTYLVLPGRQYTLPVLSVVTPLANLFDYNIGIYVPGVNYVSGDDGSGNYRQSGDEWERPASLEFFAPELSFQENIGIRINGDFTRRFPQKSLRILARGQYGNSSMDYPVFQNYPYSSFKRLILRNSGNDWGTSMFKDAAVHTLVKHFMPSQNYRPAVMFLNGEYWGIHNIRERADKHYLGRIYGVDPDNIDLLTQQYEIVEGNDVHYREMLNYIQNTNLTSDANFEGVKTRMDVENFINYFSAQIYAGNDDWPQGNIDFWRARVPYNPTAPEGQDGRWRWILYDVDRSFGANAGGGASFNSVKWVTDLRNADINQEWPNIILRKLLTNEKFKYSFINRIADHLNTAFTPNRVNHVIDSIKVLIEPEMAEHILRWGRPSSVSSWNKNVIDMKDFATVRPGYIRQHLITTFVLGSAVTVTLNVSNKTHGSIKINSLTIHDKAVGVSAAQPYPWVGTYFSGVPVTLKALAKQGYVFDYWMIGTQVNRNEEILFTPNGNTSITAYFVPSSGNSPVLASPANAATDVAVSPTTFAWNTLQGATSYRLQVSVQPDFSTTVADQSGIAATTYQVQGLANNTLYYWRVMASSATGSSDWSGVWSFRTVAAPVPLPAVATLVSPANAATNISTAPTLVWNAAANATSYSVQVSAVANFSTIAVNKDNVTGTSQQVTGLATGSVYYWRVKSHNAGGSADWSAAWSFTTLQNTTSSVLVGHWKMNSSGATVLTDDSGLGNHATLQRTTDVTWTGGVEGLAINLPGTTDRFAIAPNHASLNITNAITIAAWIRPIDVSTRTILSKVSPDGYEFGVNNDGKLEFRFNYDTNGSTYRLYSNTSYPSNGTTWMHVAATFNGTTSKLYVNGVEDASVTYSSPVTIKTNTSGLYIGSQLTSRRWKGALDDVRLYNGALPASEIAGLYLPLANARLNLNGVIAEEQLKVEQVYPNPIEKVLYLDFEGNHNTTVHVTISDILGRSYLDTDIALDGDRLAINLADANMSAGVYFLKVNAVGYNKMFKFIKR